MVLVSIFFSFHWDSLLLSLDTTAGFQWSPFPCLAVVSEALKERETKEWKGMLKCSWLAVELREWFASTRSTSRIHKMSRIIRLRVQPYERRALHPCLFLLQEWIPVLEQLVVYMRSLEALLIKKQRIQERFPKRLRDGRSMGFFLAKGRSWWTKL